MPANLTFFLIFRFSPQRSPVQIRFCTQRTLPKVLEHFCPDIMFQRFRDLQGNNLFQPNRNRPEVKASFGLLGFEEVLIASKGVR